MSAACSKLTPGHSPGNSSRQGPSPNAADPMLPQARYAIYYTRKHNSYRLQDCLTLLWKFCFKNLRLNNPKIITAPAAAWGPHKAHRRCMPKCYLAQLWPGSATWPQGQQTVPGSALVCSTDVGCSWQKNDIQQTLSVNISGKFMPSWLPNKAWLKGTVRIKYERNKRNLTVFCKSHNAEGGPIMIQSMIFLCQGGEISLRHTNST